MNLNSTLIYALVLLVAGVYFFFKKRFTYWKDRGVPYIDPIIPYGNLKDIGKKFHIKDLIASIYSQFKGKGPFAGGYFFFSPIVVITDLDLVKNVLIKDFSFFPDRKVYYNERDDPISAHMFNLDGEKWRVLRQKFSPTFTSGKMKFMFPTVLSVSKRFIDTLNEIVTTPKVIEVRDLLARYTTDVIGTCAFGIECNSLKDPNTDFRVKGQKVFSSPRHNEVVRLFMETFPKLAHLMRMKQENDDVSEFFHRIVRENIEYREKNKIRRNDFMDLLIQLKNTGRLEGNSEEVGKLSIKEITSEVYLFFVAGFETSSSTLGYALYELARNPDIQEKARSEVRKTLQNNNNELTYECVMDMKYIHQIIAETLRVYPILTVLVRRADRDYKVPNTKLIIEKGTTVAIPAYSIQHDPDIFTDPETFNPDNFHPEALKQRHPITFLPFGDGPRNCIGLRFGKMQAYVALINLLLNFRFKVSSQTQIPIKFVPSIQILTPAGGITLLIEKLM